MSKLETLEHLVNLPTKSFIQLLQIRNLAKELELFEVEAEAQKMIEIHLAHS